MDYFYLSGEEEERRIGVDSLTTSEMRRRLREIGRSDAGTRNVLRKRLSNYSQGGDEREEGEAKAHASDKPMIVMVDESNGNKYMRALEHKGLGDEGDNSWLIKDMHQELKSWGYPGGGGMH